jgi:hypothetical protein
MGLQRVALLPWLTACVAGAEELKTTFVDGGRSVPAVRKCASSSGAELLESLLLGDDDHLPRHNTNMVKVNSMPVLTYHEPGSGLPVHGAGAGSDSDEASHCLAELNCMA